MYEKSADIRDVLRLDALDATNASRGPKGPSRSFVERCLSWHVGRIDGLPHTCIRPDWHCSTTLVRPLGPIRHRPNVEEVKFWRISTEIFNDLDHPLADLRPYRVRRFTGRTGARFTSIAGAALGHPSWETVPNQSTAAGSSEYGDSCSA
jgi:hypothetical protein